MTNEKRSWILLILLSLIWGSSFILMKKSMVPVGDETVMGPYQVGSLRIFFAGLVLMPIALRHLKYLKTEVFWWLLLVGTAGNLIPALLFTLAETKINSSLAGVLNMGTSFFVVLIGVVIYKSKPSRAQLAGLILGAFGLYQILKVQLDFESGTLLYASFVLVATFCYGVGLTTIKFKLNTVSPVVITSLSFFIITFPALAIGLYTDAFTPIMNHPDGLTSLGYLIVLSVLGTAFAVFIFTKLVSISSHIFATGVTYLIPVVAVFIGQFTGEKFDLYNLIWVAVILIGVYLMNKKRASVANKTV
ncbi:MAG: DMT family transporter [Crocinitomix sp.]|nr:DMT family transporter [Crocinitomix sp.]